jgi:hypothetical protein
MPARLAVKFLADRLVGGSRERLTCLEIACQKPMVHDAKRIASLDLLLRSGVHVDDATIAREQINPGDEGIERRFEHLRIQRSDVERIRNSERATDMRRQ